MQNINAITTKLKPISIVTIATAFALTSLLAALTSPVGANNDPTAEEVVVPLWTNDAHTSRVDGVAVQPDNSSVYSVSGDGSIRQYDDEGNEDEAWRFEDYGSFNSVEVDSSNDVYSGVGTAGVYSVIKIDTNGDEVWSTTVGSWVFALAIDETNDYLYVAQGLSEGIIRLDLNDGTIDAGWEYTLPGTSLEMDLIGDDLYAAYYDGPNGGVHKIDVTTETSVWEYDYSNQAYSMAVSDDYVFVGGISNSVVKIDDSDGSEIETWTDELDETIRALAVYGDSLYANQGSELLKLDFDGELQQSVNLPDAIESLAVDSSGIAYAGTGIAGSSDLDAVVKVDFDNTEIRYSFDNVAAGLDVRDSMTNDSLVLGDGYTTVATPTIWVGLDDGTPIATAPVVINANSEGRDFSGVTADSDTDANKSFLSGIQTLTGIEGGVIDFALYVPKAATDDQVHICPGASTLTEVTVDCTDVEVYTEIDDNVSVTVIDDQAYWVVGGLAGTGGISVQSEAEEDTDTAEEDTDTAPGLPDTGVGVTANSGSGAAGNTLAIASSLAGVALATSGAYLVRRFDY